MTYMYELDWTYHESAALLHKKRDFPETVNVELDYCRNQLGCYANYTASGELKIGCDGVVYQVPIGEWT